MTALSRVAFGHFGQSPRRQGQGSEVLGLPWWQGGFSRALTLKPTGGLRGPTQGYRLNPYPYPYLFYLANADN